jgi:hypothetical protein
MSISIERLDVDRDIYSVSYDESAVDGATIEAKFHNHANGDKSVYGGSNDGSFIVSCAKGYKGSDNVTVTGVDGGEETGEVHFG